MLRRWAVLLTVAMLVAMATSGTAAGQRSSSAAGQVRVSATLARDSVLASRPHVAALPPSAAEARRGMKGALIGALVGAVLGGYIAADWERASCESPVCDGVSGGTVLAGGAIGAVAGAAVGAFVEWAWTSLRRSR